MLRMKSSPLLLATLALTLSAQALDWPQWRGPNRDDVSKETGLLKQWPEGGPKQVWMFKNAGQGYAGFSIAAGKLFTMGTRDGSEVLIALDAAKGEELWSAKIGSILGNGWGDGPRGTPTVDGKLVYALGGQGTLICANVADGKIVWQRTMQELGGKTPGWGYTESVLVDGAQVVCTPGGDQGALAAFDKMTGATLWQSKDFTEGAQYSSIIPADINGTRQYVQLVMQTLVGVSAKDGALLWRSPFAGRTAVIPTPIVRGSEVYATAGYGTGSKLVKIGAGNEATDVWMNKTMINHHGGVILVGEHLYGFSDKGGWVCQDWKTGEEKWVEKGKLGKGAIAYADGMLYLLEEKSGTVVLIEASPNGWSEKSRFTLSPQTSIRNPRGAVWTHPVVANGKLYLRDQDLVFCFDVKS